MDKNRNKRKRFIVVQFIALPFEGIDDYVCVPRDWIIIQTKQTVAVAYPKDENRFVTRDRVKNEEIFSEDWKFWVAELKYQSDTFEDADFWIATRNDYGPLVEENLSLNDTPSTSALSKKLRRNKQKSTSKSETDTAEMTQKPLQIAQKPSLRSKTKRPASDKSQPKLEIKRFKPSSATDSEPTGAVLQENGSSSSNFEPQTTSVQSLATTSNNQEPRADNSPNNGPPTSGRQLESIATRLFEKIRGKPSLVANHPVAVVEKKMRFENIPRNVAILLKDPPNLMIQNQPRQEPIIQQEIQHVAGINIERPHNASEYTRVVLQNIASDVSASQNLPSSPQLRPSFACQLDGHRNSPPLDQHMQQTRPRSPYGFNADDRMQEILIRQRKNQPIWGTPRTVVPPTLPRSKRSTPIPQETTRNTPSLLFLSLPDSIQQALLATRSRFLSEEEEFQGHLTQGTHIIMPDIPPNAQIQRGKNSNERNQVHFQVDIDSPSSASDSGISMNHNGLFDLGIPTEELLVGTTNDINESQGNSRFVSQQQMKEQFASTSAKINSTLDYMVNTFENLRTSILNLSGKYQTLLENMERFNSPENLASQASTSRNVTQEVPLVAEEREITATRRAYLTGDQNRNNVFNKAPERNPKPTSRLTLPPEYDPDDTRWTLNHREHKPGLVELMRHSNIYVRYGELKFYEQSSSDCPSLAQRILLEVFSKKALSVCSSMTEKGHGDSIYPDERPKLDEHGCLVLINYILEHGVERGWNTDLQPILKGLHDKVKEIRSRYGAMSKISSSSMSWF